MELLQQQQQDDQIHGETQGEMIFSPSAAAAFQDLNHAAFLEEQIQHNHQEIQQQQQQQMTTTNQQQYVLSSWSPAITGFNPPSSPSCSSSSSGRRSFPTGLAQKIGYLQMVVQMLGNNSPNSSSPSSSSSNSNSSSSVNRASISSNFQQEQIGRLVDQLLVAARGMFLEQQQQSGRFVGTPSVLENDFLGTTNSFSSEAVFQYPPPPPPQQQTSFQGILPKSEQDLQHVSWISTQSHHHESNFYNSAAAGGAEVEDQEDISEAVDPRESYELIELDAMEILAEHTHFCEICGKGFKRDANLRMHMRGHGDEYKTPEALARPKLSVDQITQQQQQQQLIFINHNSSPRVLTKRYSCPYAGCKRNKQHKKFVPLKTVLCVKNHYRRSHCPKLLACTRCRVKRFAVLADLKTHEKHCGREKWQCSCGTTFSRKDKLLGHISLFVGHKPLMRIIPTTTSSPPPPPQPPVIIPSNSTMRSSSFETDLSSVALYNLQQQLGSYSASAAGNSNLNISSMNLEVAIDDHGVSPSSTDRSATESCWSPNSIFSSSFVTINKNSNSHHPPPPQDSTVANPNGDNNSLGYLGLDFFDCKS